MLVNYYRFQTGSLTKRVLLPTGSEARGVLGVGSGPVVIHEEYCITIA